MKIHKNFQEKTEIGFQDLEKLVQTGLIRYVNDNCNSNFIINIAEAYGEIREKSTSNSRFSFNSAVQFQGDKTKRLQKVVDDYKNGFIDFRYLFERTDSYTRIDLTRLIDYACAIRSACRMEFSFWGIRIVNGNADYDDMLTKIIASEVQKKKEWLKLKKEIDDIVGEKEQPQQPEISPEIEKLHRELFELYALMLFVL